MKFYGIKSQRHGHLVAMWAVPPKNPDVKLCDVLYVSPASSGIKTGENIINAIMTPRGYTHERFERLPPALLSA